MSKYNEQYYIQLHSKVFGVSTSKVSDSETKFQEDLHCLARILHLLWRVGEHYGSVCCYGIVLCVLVCFCQSVSVCVSAKGPTTGIAASMLT